MNAGYLILIVLLAVAVAGCDWSIQPRCIDGKVYYLYSTKVFWYTNGMDCKIIKPGE